MTNVKYVSADGKEYDLNRENVMVTETSFHKHTWNISAKKVRRNRTSHKLEQEAMKYDIVINVRGTIEERTRFVNGLTDAVEKDVVNETPGTIWVNEAYAKVFCTEIESYPREDKGCWTELKLGLFCPDATWVTEKTLHFFKQDGVDEQGNTTQATKGTVFREFKFDFAKKKGEAVVNNSDAVSDTNFIMKIYGFVDTPKIIIDGNLYVINAMIYEGERIEINSKEGTILKIGRVGEVTNLYNSRGKEQSVFTKIPEGVHKVTWSGGFGFDLILYAERSEPRWNL